MCKGDMKWIPSDPRWTEINTDGAADIEGKWAAAVGVLRDSDGRWLVGFQRFLGRGSGRDSELWAIFHGLQVAKHQGCLRVAIGSDSSEALRMINYCLDGHFSTTIGKEISNVTDISRNPNFFLLEEKRMRLRID